MSRTKIPFADEVWNPITGCTKISPGCQRCYAENMAHRIAGRWPQAGYSKGDPFGITYHWDKLQEPFKWKTERRVFVCSMGDFFHPHIPDSYRDVVLSIVQARPHITFIFMTKRAEEAYRYFRKGTPYNVWIGASVENQVMVEERTEWIIRIPSLVRFVNVEPILGPVDLARYLPHLSWVIAGTETGKHKREADTNWLRATRDQCRSWDVPFFLMQAGENNHLDGKLHRQLPIGEIS